MQNYQFLNSRSSFLLRTILLLVGVHSILLGMAILFFTIPFYQFFFAIDPENFFFVKQSGIFLFLIGLFYLIPFFDLDILSPQSTLRPFFDVLYSPTLVAHL